MLESAGAIIYIEGEASKVGTTDDDFTLCAHHLRFAPGIHKFCSKPRAEAVDSMLCLHHAAPGKPDVLSMEYDGIPFASRNASKLSPLSESMPKSNPPAVAAIQNAQFRTE